MRERGDKTIIIIEALTPAHTAPRATVASPYLEEQQQMINLFVNERSTENITYSMMHQV